MLPESGLPESGLPGSEPLSGRVGYVLKMYPRFSETFVVTELLAMERLGVDLEVFSLRPPTDGRFHASLAELRASVTYLPHSSLRSGELWDSLRLTGSQFDDLGRHLGDLLSAEVRDAAQALELARMVRLRGISHLHAHFASVSADVARLAARIAGITYSITAHAKDIFHADVDAAALRRKLRDASDVITVSEFNLSFLRGRYGADARRVHRVYNGLDLPTFPWSDPADRAPVIAAVGRLVEKKGFDDLLRAAALLHRSGCDFRIDVVGTGERAEALRALRDELGLGDRVRFLGAAAAGPGDLRGSRGGRARRSVRGGQPTGTGTGCRRCCSRPWPWAHPAWPRPSPASRRCWPTTGPVCWSASTNPRRWRRRSTACSATPSCGPDWRARRGP